MNFTPHKIGSTKKFQIAKFLLIFLAAFAGLTFGAQEVYYQMKIEEIPVQQSIAVPFTIEKGESPQWVAARLAEEGFITSQWAFLRYADRSGFASQFQAGKFYLPQNITIPELAEKLTKAAVDEVKVTIREGLTVAEINDRLLELGLIQDREFEECVQETCNFSDFPFLPDDPKLREGFFFPDTYFVIRDQFTVEKFAKRLLSTFDEKTKEVFGNSERDGWDILKMASIVEMESRKGDERPIVAGILWNRYDAGQMLGADATTRYITGKKTEALTVTDLSDKNPWNTRAVVGLPPGAICNPSISAIEAAANPAETEYWYYLHDNTGTIHYGKTLQEHNENKANYLK